MSKLSKFFWMIICSVCFIPFNDSFGDEISDSPSIQTPLRPVVMEERLVFMKTWGLLVSVRPDGKDERTIDKDAAYYSVSPNGKWMVVFSKESEEKRMEAYSKKIEDSTRLKARLYDLQKGSFRSIVFPEGHWNYFENWWTHDGQCIHVYTGREGPSLSRTYITRILSLNLETDVFSIEQIGDNQLDIVHFFDGRYPSSKEIIYSPDKQMYLEWEWSRPALRHTDLYLVAISNNARHLLFKKNDDKFGNAISIETSPWSPDSKKFVVSRFTASTWSAFILPLINGIGDLMGFTERDTWNVYVIDKNTLHWKKIAAGGHPFWVSNLPLDFIEKNKE